MEWVTLDVRSESALLLLSVLCSTPRLPRMSTLTAGSVLGHIAAQEPSCLFLGRWSTQGLMRLQFINFHTGQ